jgi:truncated hemoglobin YjbI
MSGDAIPNALVQTRLHLPSFDPSLRKRVLRSFSAALDERHWPQNKRSLIMIGRLNQRSGQSLRARRVKLRADK